MRSIFNALFFLLFLSSCKYSSTQINVTTPPSDSVNIYAAYYGGNFGRIFMLAQAFSTKSPNSIIAMGTQGNLPFEYKSNTGVNVEVKKNITKYKDISNLILYNTNKNKDNNLYIDDVGITKGMRLTNSALKQLSNIYIVPEGTASLNFNNTQINNIINFSKIAKNNGVKNVYYMLWDSINPDSLKTSNAPISRLSSNGINFEPINFDKLSNNIKNLDSTDGFISASIYSGAINSRITSENIFVENNSFDINKENIVFLGSYTRNEINTSKTNQIKIIKHLENIIDRNKYNIIFKGHPSETSVNNWIQNNPSETSSSYFKSFPYEIWMIVGGGDHKYTFNDISYSLYLPKYPKEIYSIFSTSLYSENKNTIKIVLAYNDIKWNGAEYILTDRVNSSAEEDKKEYIRWVNLTNINLVPFKMTFDWINDVL